MQTQSPRRGGMPTRIQQEWRSSLNIWKLRSQRNRLRQWKGQTTFVSFVIWFLFTENAPKCTKNCPFQLIFVMISSDPVGTRDGHADADIRINIRIYRAISDICRIMQISASMRMAIPNHQLGPSRAMESWRTCSSVQPVSQPPISQRLSISW